MLYWPKHIVCEMSNIYFNLCGLYTEHNSNMIRIYIYKIYLLISTINIIFYTSMKIIAAKHFEIYSLKELQLVTKGQF